MTANKFIQEIVTPLSSLEYWANRVPEKIRDEIFRGIPNNSRLYEWDKAKFEIAGNFPQITIPIGRVVEDGEELSVRIATTRCGKVYTAITSSSCWFEMADTEVLSRSKDDTIVLSSCSDYYDKNVEINDTLSYNASEYIISLFFAFIKNAITINKDKRKDVATALGKIMSLKDQINENDAIGIMSEVNINRIKGIFETNNMTGGDVNIFGSTIDILLKPKYNSPYTYKDMYLSLYLNTDTGKCVAMIDNPVICEVSKVSLSPMFNDARVTTIRFERIGISDLDIGINIDEDRYDSIMPKLCKLIECLEILIEEQKEIKEDMTPKEYTTKELNSEDKQGKPKAIEEIFNRVSVIAEYLNKKKDEGESKKAKDEIRDIIEASDEMSGMVSSQYLFPLNIMIYYDYRNKSKIAITIEKDEYSPYDVYVHQIMDKPIRPKYPIKVADFGSDSQLVEIDKYNMFSVCMSSKQIKLILEDLDYIINKLEIEYDKTGDDR